MQFPDLDRKARILIWGALFGATFAVFGQTIGFGFVDYDDPKYIITNPVVLSGLNLETIRWAWTTNFHSNYHPLTWMSYLTDVSLFGTKPWGFHLTNVLLHACAAIVLFEALWAMTRRTGRSCFVAMTFAVHPLHVESVAWISERKDLLSALFGFLTLLAYERYCRSPGWARYLVVLIFFAASLCAKQTLVTLPFLLVLLDFWPLRRMRITANERSPGLPVASARRLIIEKLPLLGLSVLFSALCLRAQTGAMLIQLPVHLRVANAVLAYWQYIRQSVFPFDLCYFYPHPGPQISWPKVIAAGTAFVLMTIVACRNIRKRPYLFVGWSWFLGTLVPMLGIVQVGVQAAADRYTYIPIIGLFVMLAWFIGDALQTANSTRTKSILSVVACITFALSAAMQTQHWRNWETLWLRGVTLHPNDPNTRINYAASLYVRRRLPPAEVQAREATKLSPGWGKCHWILGLIHTRQGDADMGVACLKQAVRLEPNERKYRTALGTALTEAGRINEGIASYQEALKLTRSRSSSIGMKAEQMRDDVWRADILFRLGKAWQINGQSRQAIDCFERAVAADPSHEAARRELSEAGESPEG